MAYEYNGPEFPEHGMYLDGTPRLPNAVDLEPAAAAELGERFAAAVADVPESERVRRTALVLDAAGRIAVSRLMDGDAPTAVTLEQRPSGLSDHEYGLELEQPREAGETRTVSYSFHTDGGLLTKRAKESVATAADVERQELEKEIAANTATYGEIAAVLDPTLATMDLSPGLTAERARLQELLGAVESARLERTTHVWEPQTDADRRDAELLGLEVPEETSMASALRDMMLSGDADNAQMNYDFAHIDFLRGVIAELGDDHPVAQAAQVVLALKLLIREDSSRAEILAVEDMDRPPTDWERQQDGFRDVSGEVDTLRSLLAGARPEAAD